ncbi:hypothetical protein HC864_05145 [Candidatus Gracilibacteria bacterium]|nr:hypothetical protein [Candidatus Gracilibacteria bacterium]
MLYPISTKAQMPTGFSDNTQNTGEINQSSLNSNNNEFQTIQNPFETNSMGNSNNQAFPTFPNKNSNNNNSNKWTFNETSTFFNSTNNFGNNSTTSYFSNGNSSFGNSNIQNCGFTAYVEGVGGKEKTNSNLPQEIDLNEKGFSVRGGVSWSQQKCINPEQVLEVERMKINASNRDNCTKGMMTMVMNGVSVPKDIQTWCNNMLDNK